MLNPQQESELVQELEQADAAGQGWNSKQVAAWMSAKLDRVVRKERGWDVLQRLGYTTKTPRPRHAKAEAEQQTMFKKIFPEFVHNLQRAYGPTGVEFWAMDEHRIGLKPIIRRVWAKRGHRPQVAVNHRYQWSYVYGFVHPRTGHTFWLLMPSLSIPAFEAALREFACFVGAGLQKLVYLLVDCAGWHTSRLLQIPPGLRLCFLPTYSPELQPAEHLWPLTNQPLANRCFASLDDLETVQAERCNWLQDQPELIRSSACFHGWPDIL